MIPSPKRVPLNESSRFGLTWCTCTVSFRSSTRVCRDMSLIGHFPSAMFTDLTVLILTIIGLYRVPGRSSLWKMVFQQGQAPSTPLSCSGTLSDMSSVAHA